MEHEAVCAALLAAGAVGGVYFGVPEGDAVLPAIGYYQADNSPLSFADDDEYETYIEYAVDIWGMTGGEIIKLAARAEQSMAALGFSRLLAQDIPQDETGAMHRHLRFAMTI